MGVMNKSVDKDGLGWTRRNWETPDVRNLKWHEWSPQYRQRTYFGVTRTAAVFASTAVLFAFGQAFIPFSDSTMRHTKVGDFHGNPDPDMKDNLRRRYDKPATVKSEVEHMTKEWTPDSLTSLKDRLDNFIRRGADRLLGEQRVNPERDLFKAVQERQDTSTD